jgi:hypothetical protein
MTAWICKTCGVEHADTDQPPDVCALCADDRQYIPAAGQQWVSQADLAGRSFEATELEPDLYEFVATPHVGIGQHTLLVRTSGGNLLWEPSGAFTPEIADTVRDLGGIAAVTASHPHLTGASVSWSHAFDGVPVYYNGDDRRWIRRPDPVIRLWTDREQVLPGVTLVQAGGHFPGSCVAHWAAGADGRGALLCGDTMMVAADRRWVSFMRSYPNDIPMSARLVRKIVAALDPLEFDRIYGGFGGFVTSDAKAAVHRSAERYIGWISDEIRDPDERL